MKLISNVSVCLTLFVIALTSTPTAFAGDCCQRCGRNCDCHSVCRCVPFEKEVKVVCWGCSDTDICIPHASIRGCKHREDVCDKCEHGCCRNAGLVWWDWSPCGAKSFTRHKLMKKIVTRKIPSHKWVTEELCDACAVDCAQPTPSGKPKQPGNPLPDEQSLPKPVQPRLSTSHVE